MFPFFLPKYATGISSAIIIASYILAKKEGYVEKYINMLNEYEGLYCFEILYNDVNDLIKYL